MSSSVSTWANGAGSFFFPHLCDDTYSIASVWVLQCHLIELKNKQNNDFSLWNWSLQLIGCYCQWPEKRKWKLFMVRPTIAWVVETTIRRRETQLKLAIRLCVLRTRRQNYFLACGKLRWSPRRPSLLSAEPIFVFWPRLWFQKDFHWLPFASIDPRPPNRTLSEHTATCIRLLLAHPSLFQIYLPLSLPSRGQSNPLSRLYHSTSLEGKDR